MTPAQPVEFEFQLLGAGHDRGGFACGQDSLDTYLKTQASQDMRRKANAVFVMLRPDDPGRIVGYFTLCAIAVEPEAIPAAAQKHLPRYPLISATLIGRLAVAKPEQGKGIGAMLLARALRTAHDNASIVGSCMVVVDAIDDAASRFYQAHGFLALADQTRLILPMRTISGLVAK